MDLPSVAQETERPCLSTGRLPAPEVVRKLHPTPTSPLCDAKGGNPVGHGRPPFPPAFPSIIKKRG
jgi:hypothetical protein